jgi:hypothetical protein
MSQAEGQYVLDSLTKAISELRGGL